MDVALVATAAGDPFVNEELWAQADDQVLSLEQKALLDDNGFRVGQVGGVPPAGLQALLTSKRTCSDPRHIQQHAGKPTRLSLGPVLPVCEFQIRQEDRTIPVVLEQAECTLVVVPTLTPDGRTRLRCTPEIPHGHVTVGPQPDHDRTLWMLQKQQPTESYPALSWEVTLAANEYVIVGGRFDRPESLGHQCFIRTGEAVPQQRLLAIRTTRPAATTAGEPPSTSADEGRALGRSLPLALQAAWTTARGSEP
jgi:hypothetical protein